MPLLCLRFHRPSRAPVCPLPSSFVVKNGRKFSRVSSRIPYSNCLFDRDTGTQCRGDSGWRNFEPFFTTKLDGRGQDGARDGLWIVKQSQGHIRWSPHRAKERGSRSTSRRSLPSPAQTSPSSGAIETDTGVTATILIADDEAALRTPSRRYCAATATKAGRKARRSAELARQHQGNLKSC